MKLNIAVPTLLAWLIAAAPSHAQQIISSSPFSGGTVTNAITAPNFIPNSATCPTNGINLPAANTLGVCTNSIQALQIDGSQRLGLSTGGASPFPATNLSGFELNANPAVPPTAHDWGLASVHVTGANTGQASQPAFALDAFANFGVFSCRRASGTNAAPTQVTAGSQLCSFSNFSRDDAGYTNGVTGLQFYAINTHTTTDHSARTHIATTPTGSTTRNDNTAVFAAGLGLNTTTDPGAGNLLAAGGTIQSGVAGSQLGSLVLAGNTSGTTTISPAAAASGMISVPAVTDTLAVLGTAQTFTARQSISVGSGNLGISITTGATLPAANASTVLQLARTTNGGVQIDMNGFTTQSNIAFTRADTSSTAPSAVAAAGVIAGLFFNAHDGTAYRTTTSIRGLVQNGMSGTDRSGYLSFTTTAVGSTTNLENARLWGSGGLAVGNSVVATDPGAGGIVAAGTISTTSTTDATTTSTGALQVPGGASINKRVFMNGITTSAGVQTAVLCQSSGGEVIADSVACLASAGRFKNLHGRLADGALDRLIRLPIERWSYKPEGMFATDNWARERIGPLADDVAAMDDRLVGYDSDGRVRTYSTEQLLGFTIKAVQELAAELRAR